MKKFISFLLCIVMFVAILPSQMTYAANEEVVSNVLVSGNYKYYFSKKSNVDGARLIRANKNGKNPISLARVGEYGIYEVNSYNKGNVYFTTGDGSDGGYFFKCSVSGKKVTKISDYAFAMKLSNEIFLLSSGVFCGDWSPSILQTYNVKNNKLRTIAKYSLTSGKYGSNLYMVVADKNFSYRGNNKTQIIQYNFKTNKSKVVCETKKIFNPLKVTPNYVLYMDTQNNNNVYTFADAVTKIPDGTYRGYHKLYGDDETKETAFAKAEIKNGSLYLYGNMVAGEKTLADRFYKIKLSDNCVIEYTTGPGCEAGNAALLNSVFGQVNASTLSIEITIRNHRVNRILMYS